MLPEWKRLPLFSPATSVELRTWQWLSIVGGGLAWLLPVGDPGFSLCFFYNLTGLPCPGCGMTRSVHFALHLEPLHAFYHHPMGLLAAILIAFFWLTALWEPAGRLFENVKRHTAVALATLALGMLGFGIWRGVGVTLEEGWAARSLPAGFRIVLEDRRLMPGIDALRGLFRGGRPASDNSEAGPDELN